MCYFLNDLSIMKVFLNEIKGINFLDIGCSGSLPGKWKPLWKWINLFGFDPNKEECERVKKSGDKKYLSTTVLPYAIYDQSGEKILYKTQSMYCYSLLKPNIDIVNSFYSYKEMFEVKETEKVQTKALDEVEEIKDEDIDIFKIDSQGVEVPILSRAQQILQEAIHVEIEFNFIDSYIDQKSSFGEIEKIMLSNNFLLFDLNSNHRMPRNNHFKSNYQNEQLIYSEATWLKDYIGLYQKGLLNKKTISRQKALKALVICNLQGALSYGLELAKLFEKLGLISQIELQACAKIENWNLKQKASLWRKTVKKIIYFMLRLTPYPLRYAIKNELEVVEFEKFYVSLRAEMLKKGEPF